MLQLRVFGASELIADIANQLERIHGARHVIVSGNGAAGEALVTADLVDDAVDQAVETIKRRGLPPEDVALLRLESIGPAVAQRPLASVIWADLLSQAGANARPLARYLVFMTTAGVIAAFGVIYANTTLVVGAMAISPDLLPICAAATCPRPRPVEGDATGRAPWWSCNSADRLCHALTQADVVISSTGAPHRIVRRDRLEQAVADRRPGRAPLLLIDLAVPRDVDPAVVGLAGIEVHTLDDLNRVVERALVQRRGELPAAQAVVRVEVARFTEWLRRRGDLRDRDKGRP